MMIPSDAKRMTERRAKPFTPRRLPVFGLPTVGVSYPEMLFRGRGSRNQSTSGAMVHIH